MLRGVAPMSGTTASLNKLNADSFSVEIIFLPRHITMERNALITTDAVVVAALARSVPPSAMSYLPAHESKDDSNRNDTCARRFTCVHACIHEPFNT